jgi:cobalt-precorrin-5B (C1)-methyltransferase
VQEPPKLRRGWTTGACATAAAKAAFTALHTGIFPDPVEIGLPGGRRASFALAQTMLTDAFAQAAVVKDAGDDPDVTHGALIVVRVSPAAAGTGIMFQAGAGVGMVTRPGLPLPPGEPAINPVPRAMMRAALAEIMPAPDALIEISIPGGDILAERTLNGRLGIRGGLSILGTTGIVIPYSCAAWIDTIHRGIDVARAMSIGHVAGSTGKVSETAVKALHGLPDVALLEMGDFVGGMLKYLRTHPVPRVTIAGGVAKMTKLAQGRLDLHSKRGAADLHALALLAGAPAIAGANTVAEAFAMAAASGHALGDAVARGAWQVAAAALAGCGSALEIVVFDRDGALVGRAPFAAVHDAPPPRNRRT